MGLFIKAAAVKGHVATRSLKTERTLGCGNSRYHNGGVLPSSSLRGWSVLVSIKKKTYIESCFWVASNRLNFNFKTPAEVEKRVAFATHNLALALLKPISSPVLITF